MPFIPAAMAAWLVPSIVGGAGVAASILNRPKTPRPNPQQQQLFNRILQLQQQPITADPRILAQLMNQANLVGAGARTRGEKNIVGRGLGQSGILGQFLSDVEGRLIPQLQFGAGTEALNIARGERQNQINQLLSLSGQQPPFLQQGQGIAGAATGGLFETLMFLLGIGALGKRPGGCWIITNIYGKHDFRTQLLWSWMTSPKSGWYSRSKLGRFAVNLYYLVGQPIAQLVKRIEPLRQLFKWGFDWILQKRAIPWGLEQARRYKG